MTESDAPLAFSCFTESLVLAETSIGCEGRLTLDGAGFLLSTSSSLGSSSSVSVNSGRSSDSSCK